jgi:adenine-specific DNA-methyltransferase
LPPLAYSDRLRDALLSLSRDALAEVSARHGLSVADRRSAGAHAESIARAGLTVGDILGSAKRADLKGVCEKLGLDSSGKEKAPILARIASALGETVAPLTLAPSEPEPPKERSKAKPRQQASKNGDGGVVADYRFPEATRKNNPPAGLVEFDKPPPQPIKHYAYDPHLDPQLTWAGKAEHTSFDIETVSLHIHEQVAPQAILRAVKREDAQRTLFAEPDLPESKQIDFYAHEVGWRNRLVLGDSLLVMNSLLEREQMAGKVQCIYLDPPYGVKFNSNFQPSISRRDVKDGDDASLTREPEQIQAYRDTWTLGVHSYLTYLRDRLLLAREHLRPNLRRERASRARTDG